jgi:Transport and Golgi organisation 2
MCTLTFYPKPQNEGFILTFSRDETPDRSSIIIEQDIERGLVYPKDALHGGTWLAFSPEKQRWVCLLNGAFELHKRQLPYRKSRGKVVLECFEYRDVVQFVHHYDLKGIEPFTMILWEKGVLIELRWDGEKRHTQVLDEQIPHIYSSCTLYDKPVRTLREKWFSDFVSEHKNTEGGVEAKNFWNFHKTPNAEMPENGILMHRSSGVCTVSISQLTYNFLSQTIDFQYNELDNQQISRHQFAFPESVFADAI